MNEPSSETWWAKPSTTAPTEPNPWWTDTSTSPPPAETTPGEFTQSPSVDPNPPTLPPTPQEVPRQISPLAAGLGLASTVGVAVVIAVLSMPRGEGPVDPPPDDSPPRFVGTLPPPPDAPVKWPDAEPLLAGLALPWEPAPGLLDNLPLPTIDRPVVDKPIIVNPTHPPRLVVKRMHATPEDELRRRLEKTTELALYKSFPREEAKRLVSVAVASHKAGKPIKETATPARLKRPDLTGLPLVMGDSCKLPPSAADHLQGGSVGLRSMLRNSAPPGDLRPNPETLIKQLKGSGKHSPWLKPESIPALMQLLMAENEAVREVLVDLLSTIPDPRATAALTNRAIFDLNPRVRESAIRSLEKRPPTEYQPALLAALRHPWVPVAEHAAEALAALRRVQAVPALAAMLQHPDPSAPHDRAGKGPHIREMVRVNHFRNCLLCHAQSIQVTDKVRAVCPTTDQVLEPASGYNGPQGVFIRADVTYLRQDFSAQLPVKKAGLWPEVQRFDFIVRERAISPAEMKSLKPKEGIVTGHQRAVMFALRELTGKDVGPNPADWGKMFLGRELPVKTWHSGFKGAMALAVVEGKVHVVDGSSVVRKEADARPVKWYSDDVGITGLCPDGKGGLFAACGKAKQLLRLGIQPRSEKVVATGPDRGRFASPRRITPDGRGGVYLCDGGEGGLVYHVSLLGTVTRVPVGVSKVRAVAISPDGKTLYVAGLSTIWAHELEAVGLVGTGRLLVRLAGQVADISVDAEGLVCVLDGTARTADVYSPEGHRLARAKLPDAPVACCTVGRTLHVLTKTDLLTVDLSGVP